MIYLFKFLLHCHCECFDFLYHLSFPFSPKKFCLIVLAVAGQELYALVFCFIVQLMKM